MNLLTIDFNLLVTIVIGLFALSGFLRGWWREGITTVLLLTLVVFLTRPEVFEGVIKFINDLFAIFGVVAETGGDLSVASLQTAVETAESPITLDPTNRNLYLALLLGIILLSYFTSRVALGGTVVSTGGRIAGGALGAFNGFVVVNLVKEYLIGRLLPGTGVAATAAPDTLSVAVADVPPDTVFTGAPLGLIIGLGVVVLILVLSQRLQSTGGLKGRTPLGYKNQGK